MDPNKKFKQDVQMYMRMGYDQNQATSLAMGLPADGPPKPPAPPPAPEIVKPPVQPQATQASVGQGVRRPKKTTTQKKTTLSSTRVKRNEELLIGSGGTGLNIGGY